MKQWTDYLLPAALLITVAVGIYAYFHIFERKEYLTMAYPWCDATIESCFAYCEDETCEDVEPYKKVLIETSRLDACIDEECEALVCEAGDSGCVSYHCSEEMLEEGEYCLPIEESELEETTEEEAVEEESTVPEEEIEE